VTASTLQLTQLEEHLEQWDNRNQQHLPSLPRYQRLQEKRKRDLAVPVLKLGKSEMNGKLFHFLFFLEQNEVHIKLKIRTNKNTI